jgi:amidase
MTSLLALPTADLRAGFTTGLFTPLDVTEQLLAHIEEVDPQINSMAMVDRDGATAAAIASGARWRSGEPRGPLDGIPISLKDSIACTGMPWRHGTAPNAGLPDSATDSPPAARLREAGVVLFGKTTMPDFGMLAAGVSSLYGITRNPWHTSKNPGGSSAGAAAGLAAGIGWAAMGTDIAGSVRLPAAHCGLVGLKPTQGRIPHTSPSSVRSAGPLARSVREAWDVYRVVVKADARDNGSLPYEMVGDYAALNSASVVGLKVGVLTDMGYGIAASDEVMHVVGRAAEQLAAAGAIVSDVMPQVGDSYAALDRVFQVRAYRELMEFSEAGRELVLPSLVDWAIEAAGYDARAYHSDLAAVLLSQEALRLSLDSYDFVISPVLPQVSFAAEDVGMDATQPLAHCSFTAWFNQTGQPAATVSLGFSEGMPVGVQVIGPRFADLDVLRLAGWLEERRGYEIEWPLAPRIPAVATGR